MTVVVGGDNPRHLVRQLTAGDGYQASNQRQLLIGLGREQEVGQLRVKWPSGHIDQYSGLELNRQWLLVETDPEPHLLPAPMAILAP